MNVKMIFYGSLSLISIIILIAMLGAMNSLLRGITSSFDVSSITNTGDYCSRDSDCKQNPKECSNCVNILSGGFTVMSKCSATPIPCYCVNNACTNSTR